jgi:hypothetical protein
MMGKSTNVIVLVLTFECYAHGIRHPNLFLRGGSEMVPPSTPLSGIVNGPLPGNYDRHFVHGAVKSRFDVVTSEEAQKMRDLGIVKGKWTIESEEEPSSDVQVSLVSCINFKCRDLI